MANESPKPNTDKEEKKSIGEFLIDTGFPPLVLIGKTMKFLGTWIVIAFLAGAICTYIYSTNKSLPYHDSLWPAPAKDESKVSPPEEDMEISAKVTDWEGNNADNTIAYVTPQKYVQSISRDSDGRLRLRVPKGAYDTVILDITDPLKRACVKTITEENKSFEVKMPPGVGNVKGRITDADGRGKKGKWVCISGGQITSEICNKTDSTGKYIFEGIPACNVGQGKLKIEVAGSGESRVLERVKEFVITEVDDIKVSDGPDPQLTGILTDRDGHPVVNAGISVDAKYYGLTAPDGRFSIALPIGGWHNIEIWWGKTKLWSSRVDINSDPFNYNIKLP